MGAAAAKGVRRVDLVYMEKVISIPKFAGNFLKEHGGEKKKKQKTPKKTTLHLEQHAGGFSFDMSSHSMLHD